MRRTLRVLALLALAVAAGAPTASALIIVGFESDPVNVNQSNGFTSADSALIRFSDTVDDNDLIVVNDAVITGGSNALAVFSANDGSGLLIEFDFTANFISMDFGNDQSAGDAVLTAFLGGGFVGQLTMALDGDGVVNQNIAFAGVLFDSVTFQFTAPLTEVVDNIRVQPIPEPAAAVCFLTSCLLAGVSVRRPRAAGTAES